MLDSVGVGALPDADEYGDLTCNTLGNIVRDVKGIKLPNLQKLGLGNIIHLDGIPPVAVPMACFGKAAELSKGKDTNTGHYEIAGVIVERAFPTYPDGFPKELVDKFCKACGFTKVLGNKPASGTEILNELGEEHVKTGQPIVYTSADSVFQIAAHEEVIPPEKLWEICEKARRILTGEHNACRVIARPFIGKNNKFTRTANRRDFALDPPEKTVLDYLVEADHKVYGIGKIEDIYNKKGLTKAVHTESNLDGIKKTIEAINTEKEGLIFTNLVDFDMKFGHRNDPKGYAKALEEFDLYLPQILNGLESNDLLIITADHGCDPTYLKSTDHSREYIPIIAYTKVMKCGKGLGTRETFADIGKTVADYFGIASKLKNGSSFLSTLC